jgi:hypothetical protein
VSKSQISNSKSKINPKSKIPIYQNHGLIILIIEICNLFGACDLEIGN